MKRFPRIIHYLVFESFSQYLTNVFQICLPGCLTKAEYVGKNHSITNEKNISNYVSCWVLCQNGTNCGFWSYNNQSKDCALMQEIQKVDKSKTDYISGVKKCPGKIQFKRTILTITFKHSFYLCFLSALLQF
jgi:hypothetical protein